MDSLFERFLWLWELTVFNLPQFLQFSPELLRTWQDPEYTLVSGRFAAALLGLKGRLFLRVEDAHDVTNCVMGKAGNGMIFFKNKSKADGDAVQVLQDHWDFFC